MTVHFSGIHHIKGPKDLVQSQLMNHLSVGLDTLIAQKGNEGLVITGKDTDHFLKQQYDITLTPEQKAYTQSDDKAPAKPFLFLPIIEKIAGIDLNIPKAWIDLNMGQLVDAMGKNPDIGLPLAEKLKDLAANFPTPDFTNKLFAYFENAKAQGKDINNQPIQEENL
ncbi:MAG: hypothetical protein K2X66_08420 [Cyanobacteria bacterium]|nr:hypothetical protein [Cyanobacteriota bacterium]